MIAACRLCGDPFEKTRKNHLSCSKPCNDKWQCRKRNNVKRPYFRATVCVACGKDVSHRIAGVKFCDNACAHRYYGGFTKTERGDCPNCGDPIEDDTWRQRKFCSARCSHIWHAKRQSRERRNSMVRVHTSEEWRDLCEDFGWRCAYCQDKTRLTVDHVVPLSKGGTDEIGNIVPACVSCNCSKQSKTWPWEWAGSRKT